MVFYNPGNLFPQIRVYTGFQIQNTNSFKLNNIENNGLKNQYRLQIYGHHLYHQMFKIIKIMCRTNKKATELSDIKHETNQSV